jgi:ABC-type oligopeptide transport system substrate-binding subunit
MTQRVFGMLAVLSLLVSGCESSPSPAQYGADQVLRLVSSEDVISLDPAMIHQPSVGLSLAQNVFGGLYRFRDDLVEEPDLAKGMPQVSPDGLTWTFRLRTDARFSNGDPVTAQDVLYSWNRLASLTALASSFIFALVAGDTDVRAGKTTTLSGLTAPDDYTVVARLTEPAGYWLVELGLWAAAVVDKKVIAQKGEDWWTTPDGLVGTGPFRMTKREQGRSLDFEPVPNWWGGATGRLKRIHIDVVGDPDVQISRYLNGDFDIVGYTPSDSMAPVSDASVKRFQADQRLKAEVVLHPWLRTVILGFPLKGHLAADEQADIRRALSLALDRNRLAGVCFEAAQCMPATGGLITKGLAGYMGDGADPNAKQNIAKAQELMKSADPTGIWRNGIRIGAIARFGSQAKEVKAQWRAVFGIDAKLDVVEAQTFYRNWEQGLYDVTFGAFIVDYDSPYNWYEGLDVACRAAKIDPRFVSLIARANKKLPADALGDYKQVAQLLVDKAACFALVYHQRAILIKPWVQGAGVNNLYENHWTGISILKH